MIHGLNTMTETFAERRARLMQILSAPVANENVRLEGLELRRAEIPAPEVKPATQSSAMAAFFHVPKVRETPLTRGELNRPFQDGAIAGFNNISALENAIVANLNNFQQGQADFAEFSKLFHARFESLFHAHADANFKGFYTTEFKSNLLGDVLIYFAQANASMAYNAVIGGGGSEALVRERNMFLFTKDFAREFARENGLQDPVEIARGHTPWIFDDKSRIALARGGIGFGDVAHMRTNSEGLWWFSSINFDARQMGDGDMPYMLQMLKGGMPQKLLDALADFETTVEEDEYTLFTARENLQITPLIRARFVEALMQRLQFLVGAEHK